MMYQGGKGRLAGWIWATIDEHRGDRATFVEPFLGGCNLVTAGHDRFDSYCLSDSWGPIAALWSSAQGCWVPPYVTRDMYYGINAAPDEHEARLVGFAAHGCSFGGIRWGGYAGSTSSRDHVSEAIRAFLAKSERLRSLRDVRIVESGYASVDIDEDSVVYCDPPYAGTRGYGSPSWDQPSFVRWCESAFGSGALVVVSGYDVPTGWTELASRRRTSTLRSSDLGGTQRVERLSTPGLHG